MADRLFGSIALDKIIFLFFGLTTLIAVAGFSAFLQPLFLIVPIAFLFVYLIVVDLKKLYLLLFFVLPFSIEIYLPNGLGTDLPTEPMLLIFSVIALVLFLHNFSKIPSIYIRNPVFGLLVIHLIWIFLCTLLSENQLVSLKFFVAKTWYFLPFFCLPFFIIQSKKDLLDLIKYTFIGILISVFYVFINHASNAFSFDSINSSVSPIFRNHVNYASLLTITLPLFIFYLRWNKNAIPLKYPLRLILVFLVLSIYFSYTRVAFISLGIALISYFLIRKKLLKFCLLFIPIFGIIGISYLSINNKYLDLAPNYERTIAHYDFENLLEATYKMEDISTMERLYRWVAGFQMLKEHPIFGYGPGNFYFYYQSYTVTGFQTYVSDNPEKSGIHNYYLMTAVEQGIVGFLLFTALCFISLIYGENKYHQTNDALQKDVIMAALLVLVLIFSINLINDMFETAKLGPFFFLCLFLLIKPMKEEEPKIF